jgi:hypothetical protein
VLINIKGSSASIRPIIKEKICGWEDGGCINIPMRVYCCCISSDASAEFSFFKDLSSKSRTASVRTHSQSHLGKGK